jgi:hypothetical protein
MPSLAVSAAFLGYALITPYSCLSAPFTPQENGGGNPTSHGVLCCHPGTDGVLKGGPLRIAGQPAASLTGDIHDVVTILDHGDPDNRVDLVFIGDGYLEEDLPSFAPRCVAALEALFLYEPFASYQNFFNAHRVDLVSPERGVDNDPVQGVDRSTALDMGFWCADIERLLCVDVAAAWQAAAAAPDADQLFPMAFSTKYGGAGYYEDDIATFSSDNQYSVQVAIHELGHSLGDLADEYDYDDGATWTGDEPIESNVSAMPATEMKNSRLKWFRWLGFVQADLGVHGTFEGARYHEFGLFRPTSNSMMRELMQPFNMPSREKLIIEISKAVDLIDSSWPEESTVPADGIAGITTVDPAHDLTIIWRLNGTIIPEQVDRQLDVQSVTGVIVGDRVDVEVIDPSDIVRDEAARMQWMRSYRSWIVTEGDGLVGDLNGDGQVDGGDFGLMLAVWGKYDEDADLNQDGTVDGADLGQLLLHWTG